MMQIFCVKNAHIGYNLKFKCLSKRKNAMHLRLLRALCHMVCKAVVVLRGTAGCAGYFSESMNSRRSAASLKAPL